MQNASRWSGVPPSGAKRGALSSPFRRDDRRCCAGIPGTTTWTAALAALYARMKRERSPVNQAAILRKAITYLRSVTRMGQ
jgi:hypothetical protein